MMTAIPIDEELYEKLKIESDETGYTIDQLASRYITNGLMYDYLTSDLENRFEKVRNLFDIEAPE